MSLKDFATLVDAQAHEEVSYRKITVGEASQYFGLSGMLDNLENSSSSTTTINLGAMTTTVGALCRTILNSAKTSGFASDPATDDGANNRGAAQLLLANGVFPTQAVVDGFWEKGKITTYPHATATQEDFDEANDAGETLLLPQNNTQHVAKINIATQPSKKLTLIVQQRYGADANDLTEWHDCGQFTGVYYTQRSYESQIAASPALYRELRVVSPVTIGMSNS